MKKHFLFLLITSLFLLFLLINSCKKNTGDDPSGEWTKAEKESYDQALNTQDQVGEDLDDWFQSMDSLDAIQKAYEEFVNSENVSSATINSQGIAVQYSNGMRGGLYLNPKDDKGEVGGMPFLGHVSGKSNNLKSLVNKRKMILINPHYSDRNYYTDQIYNFATTNLGKVGMELPTFYKDEQATVDRFTELSGYGIIQIYSHGWAWPKEENITDVYLLTGETANETTSEKYWDELKKGNIPVMKVAGPNKYLVSEKFLADHNDFSNDTILFFGGFCYSFLGDWPDIIDEFADGAYVGYDWSVYTFKNANWTVNTIYHLTDTTADNPITLNDWFNDTEVPKSYWNERDNRTVNIQYTGDGNLTLWVGDTKVNLVALSEDGTPVSNPGEAGVAYPFKCEVVSDVSELEYFWDIGDGSNPVQASNEVNITWSEEGNYILKVVVKNKSNGTTIGSAQANVTIGGSGNEELIDILKQCNHVYLGFGPEMAFIWGSKKLPDAANRDPGDLEWEEAPIVWNGLSFSATITTEENNVYTISGSLSSDGYTVNAVGEQEGYKMGYNYTYKLGFNNYPVEQPYENYVVVYSVESNLIQNYVNTFEGKLVWDSGETNITDDLQREWLLSESR